MKNPLVWWRCGSREEELRAARVREGGHSSPSGSTSSPLASTMASFSSALSAQTE